MDLTPQGPGTLASGLTLRLIFYSPSSCTPLLFLMASGPQRRLISGTVEVGLQPSLAFASDAPQRLGHFIKACFTRGRPCTHNSRREAAALPILASADSGTNCSRTGPSWVALGPAGPLQRSRRKGEYLNAFLKGPQVFTEELQFGDMPADKRVGGWLEVRVGNPIWEQRVWGWGLSCCWAAVEASLFRSQGYGR